jgi:hypothetical protein
MPRLVSYKVQYAADGLTPRAAGAAGQQVDQFLEAIAKFVPVEILTVYMLIRGLSPSSEGLPGSLELGVYAILIVLTAVYLNMFGGTVPNKRAQVVIGTISFVIWTYGIGGSFFWPALELLVRAKIVYPSLAGILVLLWSLVTGLINPGATPPHTPSHASGRAHVPDDSAHHGAARD